MTKMNRSSGYHSNRREVLAIISGTVGAGFALPFNAAAAARRLGSTDRNRLVIDANLVAPIDPAEALDNKWVSMVRSSGLTTIRTTLGGSGNQNRTQTDTEISDLEKAIALNPGLYLKIASAQDLERAAQERRLGIIFAFEAAEMLEGRIENIDHFRDAGVLVMGLSYNVATPFASGVLAHSSTGLTDLGREAVGRMNRRGVTIDMSHSDERSTFDALAASRRPLVISHAGCSAIQPHPRNKSDALLKAMADHGGVIGIYELSFLVAAPRQPNIRDYIAHLEHALNICGEDHVGIGTDGPLPPFDTSPENMKGWYAEIARRKAAGVSAPGEGPPPFVIGLNRPDRSLVIGEHLQKRGYPSRIVDKVLGANFGRAFRESWEPA
jgi:membrane dipeptidase